MVYGGTKYYALQDAGKMAIRTNINNLVNNPLDEFVTIGSKDGAICNYVRSIPQTGRTYLLRFLGNLFSVFFN